MESSKTPAVIGRELAEKAFAAHSTDAERPFHGIVSSHSTAS